MQKVSNKGWQAEGEEIHMVGKWHDYTSYHSCLQKEVQGNGVHPHKIIAMVQDMGYTLHALKWQEKFSKFLLYNESSKRLAMCAKH